MAFFHSPLPSRSEWTTMAAIAVSLFEFLVHCDINWKFEKEYSFFFFFEIEHRSINRDHTKDDDRRTLTLTSLRVLLANIRLKIRAFDESILPHPTWRTRRKKHGEREREWMLCKSVQLLAIATNLAAAGLRLSNFEPCENFILYRV